MKDFDEKQAQAAVEQLNRLREEAEKAGEAAQGVLRAIEPTAQALSQKLGIGADGKLPDGTWSKLPALDRLDAQARLQGILDALAAAVASIDEPRDSRSVMYRAHASNPWIYGLVIASVVVVALVIWGIYRYWDVATSAKATEGQVLRMVILMGALGGAIHWMSSLVNYIGNGNFFRRWIPYYVLAPFQGAALAMLVYLLLRVGVLAPPTAGTGTAGPAQGLNLLGLYAFAGLTGLFAKQAIEMLRDVFAVIFKKIEGKDAGGAAKPSGSDAGKSSGTQSAAGGGAARNS
jgi:hypothetical protein